jgi:hypothetical protein
MATLCRGCPPSQAPGLPRAAAPVANLALLAPPGATRAPGRKLAGTRPVYTGRIPDWALSLQLRVIRSRNKTRRASPTHGWRRTNKARDTSRGRPSPGLGTTTSAFSAFPPPSAAIRRFSKQHLQLTFEVEHLVK